MSEILYVLFLGLMLEMYLFLGHFGKFGYAGAIIPLVGPVPFILLHIFVAVLQAFRFYDPARDLRGGCSGRRALIPRAIIRHDRSSSVIPAA